MIEIMTPERFVRSGGATRVSEDDTGCQTASNR
jgi:hypothetical protein